MTLEEAKRLVKANLKARGYQVADVSRHAVEKVAKRMVALDAGEVFRLNEFKLIIEGGQGYVCFKDNPNLVYDLIMFDKLIQDKIVVVVSLTDKDVAWKLIKEAQVALKYTLSDGERRELLTNNTDWNKETIKEIVDSLKRL